MKTFPKCDLCQDKWQLVHVCALLSTEKIIVLVVFLFSESKGLLLLWTPKLLQDRHPTNFAFLKGARIFQHFSFSWLIYHETAHGNYKVTRKKFKKCDDFKGLCLPRRRAFDSSLVQPLPGRILLVNLNNFLRTYGLWRSPMFDFIMFILMLVNYENKFNLPLPSLRFDLRAQATSYKNRYLSAFF